MPDKNKVNQSTNPITNPFSDDVKSEDFKTKSYEVKQSPNTTKSTGFDDTPFKGYLDGYVDPNDPNLVQKRADAQPWHELLGNTVAQFGANFVGGASMAAGMTFDPKQVVGSITGAEQDYGNMLYDWGKGIMEGAREDFPIFEERPGKFNPFDAAYWANQVGQTGLSVGIMAESIAETVAISALTEGMGLGAEMTNLSNKVRNVKGLKNLLSTVKNSDKARQYALRTMMFRRLNETGIEAKESFDDTYKQLIESGVEEPKARQAAAEGAAITARWNLPLLAADALTISAMTFNPISGSSSNMLEGVLGKIGNKALRTVASTGIVMASESSEEGLQEVGQMEGNHYAMASVGLAPKNEFWDRIGNEVKSDQFINSAIGGALGGVLLGGLGGVINKSASGASIRQNKQMHQDFIKNIYTVNKAFAEKIQEADLKNDPVQSANLRRQMGQFRALNGLHLDNITDSDAAYNGYIEFLQNTLDAAKKGDVEALSTLNMSATSDEAMDNIISEYPKYIEDAGRIAELYDQAKESNNKYAVIPVVYNQFQLEKLNEAKKEVDTQIDAMMASVPDLSNLSPAGQQVYDLTYNLNGYTFAEETLKNKLSQVESKEEKADIREALSEIGLTIKSMGEAIDRLYNEMDSTDENIIAAIPHNYKLEGLKGNSIQLQTAIDTTRKDLTTWNNKKFQEKATQSAIYSELADAKTVEELDGLKARLESNGTITSEIESKINNKKIKVQAKKAAVEAKERLTQNSVSQNNPFTDQAEQITNNPFSDEGSNQSIGDDVIFDEQEEEITPYPESVWKGKQLSLSPAEVEEVKALKESLSAWLEGGEFEGKPMSTDWGKKYGTRFNDLIDKGLNNRMMEVREMEEALEENEDRKQIVKGISQIGKATVVDTSDDDLMPMFAPAPLRKNIDKAYQDGVKEGIANYIASLQGDLAKPTFSDMIRDMITNSNKTEVEKNFNIYKLGWELNNFAKTDFDRVYADIFGDRKQMLQDFNKFAALGLDGKTEEEVNETNNTETDLDKELAPSSKTKDSTLKLAFLSRLYEVTTETSEDGKITKVYKNAEELNKGEYVDSRELLHPDFYNVGTKLSVVVAPNADTRMVANWNKDNWTKNEALTFAEWKEKNPNADHDEKIPMLVLNEQGKPIAMIHDTEWYNPENITGSTVGEQQQNIVEAKRQLTKFRKQVLANGGKTEITITEKKVGTKLMLDEDQEAIPVSQANPDAVVGYANSNKDIVTNKGEVIRSSQVTYIGGTMTNGESYDLRQTGVDEKGNKTFMAFDVIRDNISPEVKTSIIQALRVYLSQKDTTGAFDNNQLTNKVHTEVKRLTGYDLHRAKDLSQYIGQFIQLHGSYTMEPEEAAMNVESNSKINSGKGWITIAQGNIVWGKKGFAMQEDKEGNPLLASYVFPGLMKSPKAGAAKLRAALEQLYQNDFLGEQKQNLSEDGLKSKTTILIDKDGNVSDKGNYHDFIKSQYRTKVSSVKVEANGQVGYSSFLQPVIHFTHEGQISTSTNEIEGQTSTISNTIQDESRSTEDSNTPIVTVADTVNELEQAILSQLDELREQGWSEEDIQAMKATLERGDQDLHSPKQGATPVDAQKPIKIALDTKKRNELVRYIARLIEGSVEAKKGATVNMDDVLEVIQRDFGSMITTKEAMAKKSLANFQKLVQLGETKMQVWVNKQLQILEDMQVVRDNWDNLIDEAINTEVKRHTGIKVKVKRVKGEKPQVEVVNEDTTEKDDSEDGVDDEGQVERDNLVEKNNSKTSLQENGKVSMSYKIKRLLSQIPAYKKNGNVYEIERGFLGVPIYYGFDYYADKIRGLLTSPVEVLGADYQKQIERLKEHAGAHHWLSELVNVLEKSDDQIKNAFAYEMQGHGLSMKFVMHSFNRQTGEYTTKVYDTFANELTRVILTQWNENLKVSPLITQGSTLVNKEVAQRLLGEYNKWIELASGKAGQMSKIVTPQIAQKWLKDFGIYMSVDALEDLSQNGFYTYDAKEPLQVRYDNMFDKSTKTNGIFGYLARRLEMAIQDPAPDITVDVKNPFNDANNILKNLVKLERKYSKHITTTSGRDGSKSIYGITAGKFATDQAVKLKDQKDSTLRDELNKLPYNQNSYVLQLLIADADFREKFSIDHLGINAIKQLGVKNFKDNEITSIADADQELVKVSMMIQDNQQATVRTKSVTIDGVQYDFDFRIGRPFFLTMSDKSTMLDNATAVIDMTENELTVADGIVNMTDKMKDFLFSQLISPELKRIINHHVTAKVIGRNAHEAVNQKDYNQGAQIFHSLPEANNIQYKGMRLIDYIAQQPLEAKASMPEIMAAIRESSHELLDATMNHLVSDKLEVWKKNGYLKADKMEVGSAGLSEKIKAIDFFNTKYLKGLNQKFKIENDLNTTAEVAAWEFVLNSMLQNANNHMLFSGDIANYTQDKLFTDKDFEVLLDEKGEPLLSNGKPIALPYRPKPGNEGVYARMSRQAINVNEGKRLAMLIAPGKLLANSTGDKYLQIFLSDRKSVSTNSKFLIDLFYGKQAVTDEVTQWIADTNSTDDRVSGNAKKNLSNSFPAIADYFDIEASDAQEYTTAREAIDLVFRQGRMTIEEYNTLNAKIKTQKDSETAGRQIPDSALFNDDELRLILQPHKPVYAGMHTDGDNARMVYVKSSAFPLLPQLTKGLELNGLRRDMERLEEVTGKNIRASYGTANKVGSVKQELKIWDNQGKYKEGSIDAYQINADIDAGVSTSAMVMDRSNFRIQQDVPFKAGNKTHDDISIGTQMMKLILGDGITNIQESIFNISGQQPMNGKALLKYYNGLFNQWIKNEKTSLYNRLGINETTGISDDTNATAIALQQILKEEAENRGYPQQDVEALGFKANSKGELEFTLPVWISANSNRYEALLNSIVGNRLIHLDLPGNSFVVGSEEGFREVESSDYNNSRVIFTDAFKEELKAAETDEEGNLKKAQVFVRSQFRDNKGKLIDLFDDKYSYVDKTGKRKLRKAMVDSDLLSLSSFRIPTSSHVSMAQIEVVGILPPESGDLMITPKNFTKQMGQDFDIDKLNTYLMHHQVEKNGKISKLFSATPIDEVEDKEFKTKLIQNEILKVYSAILGNSDRRIQQKINKVLSMDFARSQAELISSLQDNSSLKYFTPLSDEHQKSKMGLGAAGKMGIGVYSNYVVFHSLVQQSTTPVRLMEEVVEDGEELKINRVPLTITLGRYNNIEAILGRLQTLDRDRTVAEAFAERQNTATDNEKEQIMGRVGVNELTINVDSLLTALGFDKDTTDKGDISLSYALLSQPIIQEYVARMKNAKATISSFDRNAEQNIIVDLREIYGGEELMDEDDTHYLTAQNMLDAIEGTLDNDNHEKTQQQALDMFLKLKSYADELTTLQSKIHIQRRGLGKSMFETIEKYNNVGKMDSNLIDGISGLVGRYISASEYSKMTQEDYEARINEGYVDFDTFMVQPTTAIGSLIVHGSKAGYELWSEYFPYEHPAVSDTMDEIIGYLSDGELREAKRIELKHDIFMNMKSYMFTSDKLGVYQGDVQGQRHRLFIDNEEKQSLATFLKNHLEAETALGEKLKNNRLLGSFTFTFEQTGMPSLIKFDNTKADDVNEEYKYQALGELVSMNEDLGQFNGEPYTTKTLVRDLVMYSYLSGGIQQAIEFVKYIPVDHLESIGFNSMARAWQRASKGTLVKSPAGELVQFWSLMLGHIDPTVKAKGWSVSKFARQYMQHSPERAPKIEVRTGKKWNVALDANSFNGQKEDIANLVHFEIADNASPRPFLSIYNSENVVGSKFQLYQFDGSKYMRIPTLGTFGMNEYSVYSSDVKPITPQGMYYSDVMPVANQENAEQSAPKNVLPFEVEDMNIHKTLESIASSHISGMSEIAESLLPYITNDLKMEISDIVIDEQTGGKGSAFYSVSRNTIVVDNQYLRESSQEDVAKTILHEVVHGITVGELDKYFDRSGGLKVDKAELPANMAKLQRIFEAATKYIGQDKVDEFKVWYKSNNKGGDLRSGEDTILYSGLNVHEFLAMVMTDKTVQQKLNEVKFKHTGESIWQQFVDTIKKIVSGLGSKFTKQSITSHAIDSLFQIAESTKNNSTFEDTNLNAPTLSKFETKLLQEALVSTDNISEPTEEDIDNILKQIDKGCK